MFKTTEGTWIGQKFRIFRIFLIVKIYCSSLGPGTDIGWKNKFWSIADSVNTSVTKECLRFILSKLVVPKNFLAESVFDKLVIVCDFIRFISRLGKAFNFKIANNFQLVFKFKCRISMRARGAKIRSTGHHFKVVRNI